MAKYTPPSPTFQKRNWLLGIAVTVFLILTYYGINIPSTVREIMSEPAAPSTFAGDIPIKITLSQSSKTSSSNFALKVTLENTSPTQPLHLLRWSNPLDPHAPAVGVFVFTSTKTGQKVPSVDLKINHKLPDSGSFSHDDEDIVGIEAGGKFEKEVDVKEHEILLKKGERYQVKAVGRWMGVWIGEHEKLEFNEGSDVRIGEFLSERIEVTIPS